MIKVTPFIMTIGDEDFKKFLSQVFTLDMLYPIFNEKSVETLFADWRGKDMLSWHKFTNGDSVVLEFYPDYYFLKKSGKDIAYQLGVPRTLDEFINDMYRYEIELYWTMWVDENFVPMQYLHREQIGTYFADLLKKMDKSQEINF
jgi:hypothetical protein